ncbi:MAG: cbb3-type cytochrome c oxidase N-terminal domain-containing protein [Verrucomicrobiales bacterium]
MSKNDDLPDDVTLRDHEYDGIQEYDQKLPNWWLFTFYITIVWFVVAWLAYYQLPIHLPDDHERLNGRLALIEERKRTELEGMLASLTNESLREMSENPQHTAAGRAVYEAKCLACHGPDLSATLNGAPLPGVPLDDNEWKYGSTPLDIMNIVTNGSPDVTKGMIPWKSQLSGSEIAQVVSYILNHQPQ